MPSAFKFLFQPVMFLLNFVSRHHFYSLQVVILFVSCFSGGFQTICLAVTILAERGNGYERG